MSVGEPPLVVGAGRMTGVRCYLDVDPGALSEALAPLGPLELRGDTRRQVALELWRVSNGRVLIGGREQGEWAHAAGALGSLVGGAWGASVSWPLGALAGVAATPLRAPPGPAGALLRMAAGAARAAREGAAAGSRRGGAIFARQVVGLTRWTIIEPYHELLLSVPDVGYPGCAAPVSVVLGMVTDLPLAFQLDHLAYYGYDKRMATFETDTRHRWDVAVDAGSFLRAELEPTGRIEGDFGREPAAAGTVQPLLGGLRERRPMLAELRRDLRATGDDLHEVEGTVEVARAIFPAVAPGTHRVTSRDAAPDRISVGFRDLEAVVTYPRRPAV